MRLVAAGAEDSAEIAELRTAAAQDLTRRYGKGHWSSPASERGVLFDLRTSTVWIAREAGAIVATLRLATRKPWAIDKSFFQRAQRPLYLTSMAVDPARQGHGIGRAALVEVVRIARAWPADAIRLDAYDSPAGAGEFYHKCGYSEVGRKSYRGNPLIYFEKAVAG